MTVEEYELIKNKLSKIQEAKVRTEGAQERLLKQMKEDYGFDTIEEAENALLEIKSKIDKNEEERNKLMKELEKFNWNSI